jgi:hypothetical protein
MWHPFKRKKRGGGGIRYLHTPVYYGEASSSKDILAKIDQSLQEVTQSPEKEHNADKLKDESRKMIALTFVFAFVIAVGIVIVFVPVYNAIVFRDAKVVVQQAQFAPLDIEKTLATLGSILGTPLGFVVGYYFKEEYNNKQARQQRSTSSAKDKVSS